MYYRLNYFFYYYLHWRYHLNQLIQHLHFILSHNHQVNNHFIHYQYLLQNQLYLMWQHAVQFVNKFLKYFMLYLVIRINRNMIYYHHLLQFLNIQRICCMQQLFFQSILYRLLNLDIIHHLMGQLFILLGWQQIQLGYNIILNMKQLLYLLDPINVL